MRMAPKIISPIPIGGPLPLAGGEKGRQLKVGDTPLREKRSPAFQAGLKGACGSVMGACGSVMAIWVRGSRSSYRFGESGVPIWTELERNVVGSSPFSKTTPQNILDRLINLAAFRNDRYNQHRCG